MKKLKEAGSYEVPKHKSNPAGDRLSNFLPKVEASIDSKAILHYFADTNTDCEDSAMATLTVTARGQVTLRKDVLQHLGIKPGEKIELDLLPDGLGILKAARPAGTIADFVGLLSGRTRKVATLEELNEAARQGWAAKE